jgi:hypothetical protein
MEAMEMNAVIGVVALVLVCGGGLVLRHFVQTRKFNDMSSSSSEGRR